MSDRDANYALGIDYGTSSVRAMLVDVATGEEAGTHVVLFEPGSDGVIVDERDPDLARQDPHAYGDEIFGQAVAGAIAAARRTRTVTPAQIRGIGVDATGSTPIPVDSRGEALGVRPEFRGDPAAMAWLWKDHTAHAEAAEITDRVRRAGLPYLAKCGGTYSSEWYWSKILHCERRHPRVAKAAYGWVECCDYIVGRLTGHGDPASMPRSLCAAGHKAMYADAWGGLPSAEFLDGLATGLSRYRDRFAAPALPSNRRAGALRAGYGELPQGTPVAVGAIDAHLGAVGAGIRGGTLVKIMGTSTCDCMVARMDRPLADIPGVCGIVPESILPDMHGIEAGQSAVGDIFDWFAKRVAPAAFGPADSHAGLTEAAAKLRPGQSGLLALDWHNGNRCVLVDPLLTGLMVGQTLATTPPEMYRALIEATAFGALAIIERIEAHGVPIREIVACGGIAEKSPLVLQIYADVTGRPIKVSRSSQTCALGAAILGSVVGGVHQSVAEAQRAMTAVKDRVYTPIPENASVYRELYALYKVLHDAFGARGEADLSGVMKSLIAIRQRVRAAGG